MSWGGLKPQKLVCSWLWRLQAQNQGVSRAALSPRALGEEEAFLPVPASGAPGVPGSWPHPSSLCLVLHVASPLPSRLSSLSLTRTPVIGLRAHKPPGRSPCEILNYIGKYPLSKKVSFVGSRYRDVGIAFGGHHPAHRPGADQALRLGRIEFGMPLNTQGQMRADFYLELGKIVEKIILREPSACNWYVIGIKVPSGSGPFSQKHRGIQDSGVWLTGTGRSGQESEDAGWAQGKPSKEVLAGDRRQPDPDMRGAGFTGVLPPGATGQHLDSLGPAEFYPNS